MASPTAYRIFSTARAGCFARDLECDSAGASCVGSAPSAALLGCSSLAAVDCAEPQHLADLDRNDTAGVVSYSSAGDALRRHSPYHLRHSPARRPRRLDSSNPVAFT